MLCQLRCESHNTNNNSTQFAAIAHMPSTTRSFSQAKQHTKTDSQTRHYTVRTHSLFPCESLDNKTNTQCIPNKPSTYQLLLLMLCLLLFSHVSLSIQLDKVPLSQVLGLLTLQQQITKLYVMRTLRSIRELLIESVEEKRSGGKTGREREERREGGRERKQKSRSYKF